MSKYEEALKEIDRIPKCLNCKYDCPACARKEYKKILKEAVEKAEKWDEKETPKKIIDKFQCPNCGGSFCPCDSNDECPSAYCPHCGHKLDWPEIGLARNWIGVMVSE